MGQLCTSGKWKSKKNVFPLRSLTCVNLDSFSETSESLEMHISSGGGKLQIARSQVSDGGTYTCVASNVEGDARKSYRLSVQGTCARMCTCAPALNCSNSSPFSASPTQHLRAGAPSRNGGPAERKYPAGVSSCRRPHPHHPVVEGRGRRQRHRRQRAQVKTPLDQKGGICRRWIW